MEETCRVHNTKSEQAWAWCKKLKAECAGWEKLNGQNGWMIVFVIRMYPQVRNGIFNDSQQMW